MSKKQKNEITIRSSAAEYLTYISTIGDQLSSVELRYEDENIWLTQRLMAELYGVGLPTINEHIKKIYDDRELSEDATIRNFRIELQAIRHIPMTMEDWEERLNGFLTLWNPDILKDSGKVSAELAKMKAETEFEKFRIVQDRLYQSDFDRFLQLEDKTKE